MGKAKEVFNVKTVAVMAMLCAVAFAAKLVSNVFPAVSGFLSFDLKDVVIVVGGFILGPAAALIISIVVSIIEMVTVSATGVIGLLMNVLASCAFACTASVIYRRNRSIKGAVIGLISGVLFMTAIMLLWNWIITPLYMNVSREVVTGMLLSVFLPFNLVKGGINATLTMILYKPIISALRRATLIESSSGKRTTKWGIMAISVILFASFVLLALVLANVI